MVRSLNGTRTEPKNHLQFIVMVCVKVLPPNGTGLVSKSSAFSIKKTSNMASVLFGMKTVKKDSPPSLLMIKWKVIQKAGFPTDNNNSTIISEITLSMVFARNGMRLARKFLNFNSLTENRSKIF